MSATATITVACPRCDGPAIITLTTLSADGEDRIVEFACAAGHAISGDEAMQLWEAALDQRAD